MIYLSEVGHESFLKLVRMVGLGRSALRLIPADADQRMDLAALCERMRRDKELERLPLCVVGTAGTTGAGAIDPLVEMRAIADDFEAFFHVDAAWGGTALLSEQLAPALAGIEKADSVTWDAHKWMSVPMGAGMFFSRHPQAVARAFSVRSGFATGISAADEDAFLTTSQWSRRFIGLPVFVALATMGREGYAAQVDGQAAMADLLRELLEEAGFLLEVATPLPTVCFSHPSVEARALAQAIVETGEAWITTTRLVAPKRCVLRASITSHKTKEGDLRQLVALLVESAAKF